MPSISTSGHTTGGGARAWRRFLLKETATFADLHLALQDAAGYWDYHLYEFIGLGNRRLARSPHDEGGGSPSAANVKLKSYFPAEGICGYIYDFGDMWVHDVELLGVVESTERFTRRLLDGKRAFPPEDCGGTSGYRSCVKALKHPAKADPELLEWLDDWRPEAFDLPTVKATFDLGKRPRPLRAKIAGI